jgi:hypothetical protein
MDRAGMTARTFLALLLTYVILPRPAAAKCADGRHYFCVPVTFRKANASLKSADRLPKNCAGFIEMKGGLVPAAFQDAGPCPAPDTNLTGHLVTICQDTGLWTEATYWFANRPAFCGMSHGDRRRQATVLASQIKPGMTRASVRKLLKDYEYIGAGFGAQFTEQYYGHPNIVIEIPFDEPSGAYSSENKVSDRATVAEMDMPQP